MTDAISSSERPGSSREHRARRRSTGGRASPPARAAASRPGGRRRADLVPAPRSPAASTATTRPPSTTHRRPRGQHPLAVEDPARRPRLHGSPPRPPVRALRSVASPSVARSTASAQWSLTGSRSRCVAVTVSPVPGSSSTWSNCTRGFHDGYVATRAARVHRVLNPTSRPGRLRSPSRTRGPGRVRPTGPARAAARRSIPGTNDRWVPTTVSGPPASRPGRPARRAARRRRASAPGRAPGAAARPARA